MLKLKDIDQPEDTLNALLEYAKNPIGFLLLAGKNGSGKSFAAEAIYQTQTPYILPNHDHDLALFITQSRLNIEWTKQISDYGNSEELLNKCINTKLLVLDDLGTRIPTPAFMDFLYAIIDERWILRSKLGTIITTNLNVSDINTNFGTAIVSRISSGICLRMDGKDRRINKVIKIFD